jgi:hypothetical protein
MRPIFVTVFCIVSAAVGAGIDHYRGGLPWLARSHAAQTEQQTMNPPSLGKVEVLGNRVRCDVRYMELKIPEREYREFFDKCMDNRAGMKKEE